MYIQHKTYTIQPSNGRRFAFGDVHGCFKTLVALLTKINASDDDQLFFLGDMIDRGKHSELVLDFLIHGQSNNKNVFCLRGNHEHYLLNIIDRLDEETPRIFVAKNNLYFLFDKHKRMKLKYLEFFSNLPFYFELPNQYLVHAGFSFKGNPFENLEDMLTIRDFKPDLKFLADKKFVIGHTPIGLSEIQKSVKKNAEVINIDNGCVLADRFSGKGNLVCIDLETYEIFSQKNIEE